jgi:hypothetical protein
MAPATVPLTTDTYASNLGMSIHAQLTKPARSRLDLFIDSPLWDHCQSQVTRKRKRRVVVEVVLNANRHELA